MTDLALDLGPKRLQVFQELIPGLKRVVFLYDAAEAASVREAKGYRDAAHHLGMALVERAVQTQEEAKATLAQIQKGEVDGFLVPRSLALNIPGFLVEAAAQRAMPVVCDGVAPDQMTVNTCRKKFFPIPYMRRAGTKQATLPATSSNGSCSAI